MSSRAAFFFCAAVFLTSACSSSDDCDVAKSDDATAPRVTEFALVEQLDGDPWTLVFSVGFTDSDGDVGAGDIEFFLNGSGTAATVELVDLFRQVALDANATSGTFAVPLRFGESVDDGASVRLGIQLIDAEDQRSNCYSLKLDFDVSQAAVATPSACRLALALQGLHEGAKTSRDERRVVPSRSTR